MTEQALIPLESINAVEVFTGTKLPELLAAIRTEAMTLVPDVTTAKGRDLIKSTAYKVARSKTTIDDAGKELVERIKPLVKRSFRPEVMGGLGGFGALFDLSNKYREPVLVSGTDGVGTKLKLAHQLNRHDTIGIDLVAMCVNDVLVQGAEPLFFLDYFATGKLDIDTAAAVVGEAWRRSSQSSEGWTCLWTQ